MAETHFTPLGAILLRPALERLRTAVSDHVGPATPEALRAILDANAVIRKAETSDRMLASLSIKSQMPQVGLDPELVAAVAISLEWEGREKLYRAEQEATKHRFRQAADAGQITAYIKSWSTGSEIPIAAKQWGMDTFAQHAFISGNGWAWINGIKAEGHIFLWEADLEASLLGSRAVESEIRVHPPSPTSEPAGGKRGGRPSVPRAEAKKALTALGFPTRDVTPADVQAELKRGSKLGLYQVDFASADTIARAKDEILANPA